MPDTAVRVRRARSFDLNDVADLWADCGLVPPPRGFRNEMERMLLRMPELFLVAVGTGDDGRILGALLGSYDGRAATVSRLATHPRHRRRGIATTLMESFSAVLADMGALDAPLVVLDDTSDSRHFWEALDYSHERDVRLYRRGTGDR